MKSLLTAVLLTGFVSIVIFGVFGMHTGTQNHDGGCVLAVSQGADCPKQSTSLEYLAFHFDAFRDFSRATLGENFLASLALSLLAAGAGLSLFLGNAAPPQLDFAYFRYRHRENFSPPLRRLFLRWLALHENSPSVS